MKAAINQLEISLKILENNEPINRAQGNIQQADLEAVSAVQIREALKILTTIDIASNVAEISSEQAQAGLSAVSKQYDQAPNSTMINLSLDMKEIFINSRKGYAVIIVEGESAEVVRTALHSISNPSHPHSQAKAANDRVDRIAAEIDKKVGDQLNREMCYLRDMVKAARAAQSASKENSLSDISEELKAHKEVDIDDQLGRYVTRRRNYLYGQIGAIDMLASSADRASQAERDALLHLLTLPKH